MNWPNKIYFALLRDFLCALCVKQKCWYFSFTFAVCFLFSLNTYALSEKEYFHIRDSLQHQVNMTTGREHVDALFHLIRHIVAYEQDTAEDLILEEFELAERLNYKDGLAKAYQNQGYLLYHRDDFMSGLESMQQAATLFEEEANYSEAGYSLLMMLPIYHFTGNSDLNRDLFPRIIDFFKKARNTHYLSIFYHWLAYHYNNFDVNPELAKHYITEALKMRQENTYPIVISGWYGSLALAYSRTEKYDSALTALHLANDHLKSDSDDEAVTRLINERDIGNVFMNLGEIDSAIFYFKGALRKADSLSYQYGSALCRLNLGAFNQKSQNYEEAIANFRVAYEMVYEINKSGSFFAESDKKYTTEWIGDAWPGNPKYLTRGNKRYWAKFILKTAAYYLSESYRLNGDAEKAFEYYRQYHAWSDSLARLERARDLMGLQIAYETRLKDRQIDTLSQANELKELRLRQSIYLIVGLGVFILLSISYLLLLNRQRKLREEQEKGLLKQKLFQLQMNPHFIFNSLSSIQHLVVEEDAEKASIYLAKFSTLFRNILYSSAEETITLENEIKNIENYLTLQKLRYNKKFDYTVEIDPDLDIENIEIPVMMFQPFIENAIEHGIRHKEGKGNIQIHIGRKNDSTIFEVEDDGVGRLKAQEIQAQQNASHKSLATVITRERIAALNRKSKKKITLEIIDLKDDEGNAKGTLVRFVLPL